MKWIRRKWKSAIGRHFKRTEVIDGHTYGRWVHFMKPGDRNRFGDLHFERVATTDKGYKFKLVDDFSFSFKMTKPAGGAHLPFLDFSPRALTGYMTLIAGYHWDGPSATTVDRMENMGPSAKHDGKYQLMRMSYLDWRTERKLADEAMRDDCKAAGMWGPWSKFYSRGLGWFGESSARPRDGAG